MTLTLQVGVIAAATMAVCCGSGVSVASDAQMACCKEGGPAHICPMKSKKPRDPHAPLMKSCCDVDQQALAALLGVVGIAEAPYSTLPADHTALAIAGPVEQPNPLVSPPDSPPPRA